MSDQQTTQLGFDALLKDAEADNRTRKLERQTAHLPATMDEAIPFYAELIQHHHAAMLGADVEETMRLRKEAHLLARKLDGEGRGILAHNNAPGYVLARETAAANGAKPLWGQQGEFVVNVSGMAVRIDMGGMFGIGASCGFWLGFSTHAVRPDQPFLSSTGYRSFLGVYADIELGLTPSTFVTRVIEAYVARELKGKRVKIDECYRAKFEATA